MAPNGIDLPPPLESDHDYIVAIYRVVNEHTASLTDNTKRISALEKWRVAWGVGAIFGLGAISLLVQHIVSTGGIRIP